MLGDSRFAPFYSIPFFVATGLLIAMLVSDGNLAGNFGFNHGGYFVGAFFIEWYAVLALAMASLVGGVLLVALRSRTMVKAGVVGAGLAIAVFLGAILTYSWVGFSSAAGVAAYLFGLSYVGPGNETGPHHPYLYPLILGVFIATFATGLVAAALDRRSQVSKPTPQVESNSPRGRPSDPL